MQQPENQALDRKQPLVGQSEESVDGEIDLVELLYRLIEKWKIIVLACLLGALIAAVCTFYFITPMYTATSKLYVVNAKDSAINLFADHRHGSIHKDALALHTRLICSIRDIRAAANQRNCLFAGQSNRRACLHRWVSHRKIILKRHRHAAEQIVQRGNRIQRDFHIQFQLRATQKPLHRAQRVLASLPFIHAVTVR